jgi:Domain of unknown function (DUF4350)
MSAPVSERPGAPARADGSTRPGAAAARPAGGPAARSWRAWRTPLAIVTFVLVAATAIALLQPRSAVAGYLSPDSTAPEGTHALADILGQRGHDVLPVTTVPEAVAAAAPGSTLVIVSPFLLTGRQLRALASTPASLVLVEPDPAALAILAPAVRQAGGGPVQALLPACTLRAAVLAGPADLGGPGLRVEAGTPAAQCYIQDGRATLIQYRSGSRLITVVSSGDLLTNGRLASQGNAALAVNLLSSGGRVTWLVPATPGAGGAAGRKSLASLVPLPAYLVAIQLALAALLAAAWRARRLGPLITERLPVVVRAAETVEGHARLYQSRRARARVAAELRAALLARAGPAAGLPAGASPAAVTAALAARSALSETRISELLYGATPGSDADLITLATDLDSLEREVRSS